MIEICEKDPPWSSWIIYLLYFVSSRSSYKLRYIVWYLSLCNCQCRRISRHEGCHISAMCCSIDENGTNGSRKISGHWEWMPRIDISVDKENICRTRAKIFATIICICVIDSRCNGKINSEAIHTRINIELQRNQISKGLERARCICRLKISKLRTSLVRPLPEAKTSCVCRKVSQSGNIWFIWWIKTRKIVLLQENIR